jgi:hypothetical protein
MMTFKTKMKPNWQMENENLWGVKYPKATYPSRTKHEIELFDIKGYVQKKKEEKINEMMNGNGGGMPFMPQGRDSGFVPPMFNPRPKQDNSFNVDDLVKRIDAKIAELEAEEEREKQEQLKQQEQNKVQEKETSKVETKEEQDFEEDLDIYEDIKDDFDLKSSHKEDKDTKNKITDDQFFDDFFADDE